MVEWSRYNFLINSPKCGRLLYNSFTNGILELDESIYDDFVNLAASDKAAEKLLENFSEEEQSYLKENYILSHDEMLLEHMHHQSLQRIYSQKHLSLTIAPTQNCNFKCTYCFENFRTSQYMSDETEAALIRYLNQQKEKNGLEVISLTWYGGEPLLVPERLQSLGTKIKETGLTIQNSGIITNGYLLDKLHLEVLKEIDVSTIQITIDGFQQQHDQRRPLKSGKGTFERIIQNIDAFFANGYHRTMFLAIRINVDQTNKKEYASIYHWLKQRYPFDNYRIYPGWVQKGDDDTLKSDCFSRKEITDFSIELYKKDQILTDKLFPKDNCQQCLVRNPYNMILGPKGEIYKCYEDIGDETLVVGNIQNEPVWSNHDLITKYAVGLDHFQDQQCRSCAYLPICHGGCPKRRYENKYDNKKNDYCTPFKGRIEEYIEILKDRF